MDTTTTPTLDDARTRLLARLSDPATAAADLPLIASAIQVLQTTSSMSAVLPLAHAALEQLTGMWSAQQEHDAEAHEWRRERREVEARERDELAKLRKRKAKAAAKKAPKTGAGGPN